MLSPRSARTVVLCYHSIDNDGTLLSVTQEAFAAQMDWLARSGCDVISFDDVCQPDADPSRTRVAITFDDGYRNLLTAAMPVLARHRFPATVFVTPGWVGQRPGWIDRDFEGLMDEGTGVEQDQARRRSILVSVMPSQARLTPAAQDRAVAATCAAARLPLLDWNELANVRDGGVRIGAHSMSHVMLTRLDDAGIRDEALQSRVEIERRIGCEVTAFCYPYGDFDTRVVEAVRASGFRLACTTRPGVMQGRPDDPFRIARVSVLSGVTRWKFPLYFGWPYALYSRVRARRLPADGGAL